MYSEASIAPGRTIFIYCTEDLQLEFDVFRYSFDHKVRFGQPRVLRRRDDSRQNRDFVVLLILFFATSGRDFSRWSQAHGRETVARCR